MIRARQLATSFSWLSIAAALAGGLLVGSSSVLAAIAVRITDLRPGGESGVANLDAAVFQDKLYFAATATGADLDLWVYDGVAAPTMVPGGGQLQPEELTVWQGALYFEGGPFSDRELWRYDGVNPPVEALDLVAPGSGQPTNLVAFGPEICFGAFTTPEEGNQLVCWDGATAPDVHELRKGGGASPEEMTVIGSTLYFDAYADEVGSEPFAYENFFPPVLVGDLNPGIGSSNPESFTRIGATLYWSASGSGGQGRVWRDDGVSPPAQVSLLLDVEGGVVAWHQRLFAVGTLDEEGATLGGIQQLHALSAGDFVPAGEPAWALLGATNFLDHRNALYFRASGGANPSTDLFRYCGAGNVERLTDQFADASYVSSAPIVFQGRIYFSAYVAAFGHELWAIDPLEPVLCDGFEAGTDGAWSVSVP